jgi:hypothetical protein
MALNVDLDASFDNMQEKNGRRETAGGVNGTKAYAIIDETFR